MNTILDAIKMYPQQFIDTCYVRSQSTPSPLNKNNHLFLAEKIKENDWGMVEDKLTRAAYSKLLKGVILCLERYSDIDNETWHEIVKLYEEGKLV
jgi:hypothetical protein